MKSDLAVKSLAPSASLSKTRLVHGMQCPLYVWLDVRTDAPRAEFDEFMKALLAAGHETGQYARQRWDRRLQVAGQAPGRISEDPTQHDTALAATEGPFLRVQVSCTRLPSLTAV